MQKKLIALAIAGLASTAAFAQTNVTIYGVADGTFDVIDQSDATNRAGQTTAAYNPNKGTFNRVSSNSSLIGFKGTEDLGNGLKAVFQFESNVSLDTNGGLNGIRDTFVGVADAKFGTVVMGNLTGPTRALGAALDVNSGATGIGGNSALLGKMAGYRNPSDFVANPLATTAQCATSTTCNSAFDTRWANSIAYISPSFSGFSGVAAYVADENKTSEVSASPTRTTGYDLGLKYANGPWMAAVTYNWYQVGDTVGTQADNLRVGGSYTGSNWSVRVMWEETQWDATNISGFNTKQQKWGIGGTYMVGKANLIAQYYQAMDMDTIQSSIGNLNGDNTGAQLAVVGVEYSLSKRTMLKGVYSWLSNDSQAIFDYGVNAAGAAGVGSTLQGVQMGVRHVF